MRQGLNTCSRPICDALACLQFNVILLPESYLRPFVTHTGLTVGTALFLLVIITHSSSVKGPRLNFHAERELAHPKTTFFSSFLHLQYPHVRRRRVVCRYSKKQVTHRQCWGTGVLHTPVQVATVRFSMTCSFVDGQGKRGNVHIQAIMSVAFPDFVVFDGFI